MEDMKKIEWEEKEEIVLQKDHIKPTKEFVSPESLYEELVASVRRYHPSTDISLIEKAYRIADEAHKGQARKSGEAYIIHPLCVNTISSFSSHSIFFISSIGISPSYCFPAESRWQITLTRRIVPNFSAPLYPHFIFVISYIIIHFSEIATFSCIFAGFFP